MKKLINASIRSKLIFIILTITSSALVINTISEIVMDIKHYKVDLIDQSVLNATLCAQFCIEPLKFDKPDDAMKVLFEFHHTTSIEYSHLLDTEGEIFSKYGILKENIKIPPIPKNGILTKFDDGYIHIYRSIDMDGVNYGTIYLLVSTAEMRAEIQTDIAIAFFVFILVLIWVYFIARRLQRTISDPILKLSTLLEDVSKSNDYSIRINKRRDDEIGKLYDGFNNFLNQIELQNTNRNIAEKQLRESEIKFRTIVTNTEEILFMIDSNGIFTLSEGKGLSALGLEPGQVVGHSAYEVYKDFPKIIKGIKVALSGKNHKEIIDVGGIIFSIWYSPNYYNNQEVIGLIGMATNITEQYSAEKKLKSSEMKFRSVIDSATDAIISINSSGIIIGWNKSATIIFGYSYAEVMGKDITLIIPERFIKPHKEALSKASKRKKINIFRKKIVEIVGKRKDNTEFFIEISLSNWRMDNEIHFTALIRDITDRKKAEDEISKLSNAVEQSHSSIVISDLEGNIEYVNQHFSEVTGYSKEEVIGQNSRILKTDYLNKEFYIDMWKTLTSGNTWRGEFQNKKKDGELFWEKAIISPIKDKNEKTIHYLAIKDDVTALKKNQEERLYLANLVDSSVNEIYIFNKESLKFSYLNESAIKNIGYSLEEIKLMTPLDIKPEISKEKFNELIEPLINNDKNYVKFQTTHKRKDNSEYFVDVSIQLAIHDGKNNFIAIIIDITKRKNAELELLQYQSHLEELVAERTKLLKESVETFRTLAENSEDTIMRFNKECVHLYVNQATIKHTGIPVSKIIGKTHSELGFPKDLCELWEDAIMEVFETKKKNRIEFMLPSKAWIDWSLLPEFDSEGNVNVVLTFGHDISGRKVIENRIKDSLRKEKELNELKDQFISTVSHDLRTPLAAIISSVDLMKRFHDKWDKKQFTTKYEQIIKSAFRISDMLNHVLELSRIERGNLTVNPQMENLKESIQTIVDEITILKSNKHQFIFNYNIEEKIISVDIYLIREIILNLLTNAIKYSPNGGSIELLVNQKDNWLFLQVSDEGVGISENEKDVIFNEFYRTDGSQNISGSGLGLSIVKHYVNIYNGQISVESELGTGSIFKIKIPIIDSNL